VTFPAGEVCPFALHGEATKDEERVRNLLAYPDGTPQEQEFTGPLSFRWTNLSTGKSVVRDLSGTFDFAINADGTRNFTVEHGSAENLCQTLA